jgi:hypothetical protein
MRLFEKSAGCMGDNFRTRLFARSTASNCYNITNTQCDTKAIEARTEIRSARRNANRNLLHSETECSDAQLQRQPIR